MLRFPYAPITALVDWWTTSDEYRKLHVERPSQLGVDALTVLREEDGNGEVGGNNRGPHIRRYGGRQGKSWCGWAYYYAVKVASIRRGQAVPFGPSGGARKLFRLTAQHGMRVDLIDIQHGDTVLFDRGNPHKPEDDWKAHIGMVSRVIRNANGIVVKWFYRAGNEGRNAVVEEHEGTGRGRLIGFARLPELSNAGVAQGLVPPSTSTGQACPRELLVASVTAVPVPTRAVLVGSDGAPVDTQISRRLDLGQLSLLLSLDEGPKVWVNTGQPIQAHGPVHGRPPIAARDHVRTSGSAYVPHSTHIHLWLGSISHGCPFAHMGRSSSGVCSVIHAPHVSVSV